MTTTAPETSTVAAPEVCALAGISYRQLDFWLRAGHIKRDVGVPVQPGSGHPRQFSEREVQQFVILAWLVRCGVRLEVASAALHTYDADRKTVCLPFGGVIDLSACL